MFWALILIFLFCGLFFFWEWNQKRKKLPPGPFPFPFIGNIFQLDSIQPQNTILEWAKIYGPIITVWFGPQATVILNDFQLFREHFLGKNSDLFTGRPENWIFQEFSKGRFGLVTTDGILWRKQRRFCLHFLRDLGFGRNLMAEKILKQADLLIARIRQSLAGKSNGVVDLNRLFEFCIGNIIGNAIVGKTLDSDEESFLEFKQNLSDLFKLIATPEATLLAMYPALRFVPLFNYFRHGEMNNKAAAMTKFLEGHISERKTAFNPDLPASNFVDAYLQKLHQTSTSNIEEDDGFCDQQLLTVVGELFSAGMETTVATLNWIIIFLITHPSVQNRVHQELNSFYANSARDSPITWGDRLALPFLMATITEVFRLATILPVNLQHIVTADVQISGYTLPKGTVIIPQMASVHLDPDIFPNPDMFDPNRFLVDKELSQKVIPFSLGKRQCLGESLARMELFLIVTSIFKYFRLSMVDQQNPPSMEPERGINSIPKPYKVLVRVKH